MLLLLLMPCAGAAQTVSVGVIGGVPVTPAYETASATTSGPNAEQVSYISRAKPFTFGPAIEVSLPYGFALEFDALYKRLNYNASFNRLIPFGVGFVAPLIGEDHNVITRWDLPLLLKYRLRNIAHTPHFSVGLNTNYIVNTTDKGIGALYFTGVLAPGPGPITLPPPVTNHNPPPELRYRSSEGVVVAAGFEFRFHNIRFAPELRYTRWAHENFHEVTSVGKLRSNLDQAEVLVTLGLVRK